MIERINSYQEWIVEIVTFDSVDKERQTFATLGKIFVLETLHLNNQQLEEIWDLCNYGVSYPENYYIPEGIYLEITAYYRNENLFYIPMNKGIEQSVVNCDIYIRKKIDLNNGYFIYSNPSTKQDEWMYSTRKEALDRIKQNSLQ